MSLKPGSKIFIAGPYTQGDPAVNVKKAVEVADFLLEMGHFPYVPHLNHFWHMLHPHPYETWTEADLIWLCVCDAVVRLPGYSPGADEEIRRAEWEGIPVYRWEEFGDEL
jgi:hypothetical protein